MVTHDLSLAQKARRLVQMEDGNVISDSAAQGKAAVE
jgi:predicted ABC-type transport system involved in lysophospholipase L1 biosynthesis ATPase subunit